MLAAFFVADAAELRDAFPSKALPAAEPAQRTIANPFTGAEQIVSYWPAAESDSQPDVEDESKDGNIHHLTHLETKNIDHSALACLHAVLCDTEVDASLPELTRPALVTPGNPDTDLMAGVNQIRREFTTRLANIPEDEYPNLLQRWNVEFEANSPGEMTLESLRDLAQLAKAATAHEKDLFLSWSL